MVLTKEALVRELAAAEPLRPVTCRILLDALFHPTGGLIKEALDLEGTLEIDGFGTFQRIERPPRRAHVPRTGAFVDVPQRRDAVFRADSALIEALR